MHRAARARTFGATEMIEQSPDWLDRAADQTERERAESQMVSMKAYALTDGSETRLFLDESDALSALKLKEILGKKSWRVVELSEVQK